MLSRAMVTTPPGFAARFANSRALWDGVKRAGSNKICYLTGREKAIPFVGLRAPCALLFCFF